MIVVDLETSGLDTQKCGVWQIGAVDLENPEDTFLEEARVDDEDIIEKDALKIIGKTEADLRDKKKQSQKELLANFFEWVNEHKTRVMISQNPQTIDFNMLVLKANKYDLEFPFHYRVFDLHSVAQMKYFELNGEFLMMNNTSEMRLGNILKLAGMIDTREKHNALEDARLSAECFSRIVYGKSLFAEYFDIKVPRYLRPEEAD
jgi:DNA polymerase III epsilon subunit-like protein